MITKQEAKILYDYYDELIKKLINAKKSLIDGGVKSYTIDDRSLTRFDLDRLSDELNEAIKKRAEMSAILHGRKMRKAVGAIPRDY